MVLHNIGNNLLLQVIERNCELDLPVARADKRFFSLQHRVAGNDPWGLVSDVQVQDGSTLITLRSIIQVSMSVVLIYNHVIFIYICHIYLICRLDLS